MNPRLAPPVLLDPQSLDRVHCDVVVVGSGIAGLAVAAELSACRPSPRVAVVSKGPMRSGSTILAQGGIAAAGEEDSPAGHAADTMSVGGGLCEAAAVQVLTEEAEAAIGFLASAGVCFDETEDGLARTLEGGHSRPRILHCGGDATGAELWRALFASLGAAVEPFVNTHVLDLVVGPSGSVAGVLAHRDGVPVVLEAPVVVLATGGAGRLFEASTASPDSAGEGLAMALRAGADLADMEFIQFHPTGLAFGADPRPLLTEALRGEGALLFDAAGRRFMQGVHPRAELAPRDVVAREIFSVMSATSATHVYLDATSIGEARMKERFPTVWALCEAAGLDPSSEPIPVAPAAHYTMGGIRTDLFGRSSITGLYAVGEVGSTGVHGANRLASNSLLEGVVFGRRAARHIGESSLPRQVPIRIPMGNPAHARGPDYLDGQRIRRLRASMTLGAGVSRSASGLETLTQELESMMPPSIAGPALSSRDAATSIKFANMVQVASAIAASAERRRESRGSHWRADFPLPWPGAPLHQVLRREGEEIIPRWVAAEGNESSHSEDRPASLSLVSNEGARS